MTKHDERIEQIRVHLRGVHFRTYPRPNFMGFVMASERGGELARDFIRKNSLLKPLLEWTKADEQYGVLILNRQRCCNCHEKWDEHATPGGKCLFDAASYAEGPL